MVRGQFMSLPLAGLLLGVLLLGPVNGLSYPALILPSEARNGPTQVAQPRAQPLEFNKPIERKLSGGETHLFEINLSADQFLRVLVDQRSVDVVLTLFSPDGAKIREVDNRSSERGAERASLITKRAGSYRIEVRSLRKTAPLGTYQINLEALHPADERARAIDATEQLMAEGNMQRARSTKESLAQAVVKYWQALVLSDTAGDSYMKAAVLNKLGRSHFALGEYQKALDYHQQALPVARAASDVQAEAATLTYIGDAYRLMAEKEKALEYLSMAIQRWQKIRDRRGEVEALNLLARVRSRTPRAQKSFRPSVARYAELPGVVVVIAATHDQLRWQVIAVDAKGSKVNETARRTLRIVRE